MAILIRERQPPWNRPFISEIKPTNPNLLRHLDDLILKAQTVLKDNVFVSKSGNDNGYTAASGKKLIAGETEPRFLYPFQWLWDTFFISAWNNNVGQSSADISKFFAGQTPDGFLGHIRYNRSALSDYFPGPSLLYYDNHLPETGEIISKITQPPNAAYGVLETANKLPRADRLKLLQEYYPKLFKYHSYIYENLFIDNKFIIIHPWQNGDDNSPKWDSIYEAFHDNSVLKQEIKSWYQEHGKINGFDPNLPLDENSIFTFVKTWLESNGVAYERIDTKLIPPNQRPTGNHYDKYLLLMFLYSRWGWDYKKILDQSPYKVADPLSNAILLRSDLALLDIAKQLGKTEDSKTIENWITSSKAGLESLWDNQEKLYFAKNISDGKLIKVKTTSSFAPLFSRAIPYMRASQLADQLFKTMLQAPQTYLVPSSFPIVEADRYWRGSVWPVVNTLIIEGLIYYGHEKLAAKIMADTISMIDKDDVEGGFHEYYRAKKEGQGLKSNSTGLGSPRQSWTAAAILKITDMIRQSKSLSQLVSSYLNK
ncbi:hypothetical protein M1328_05315 [Patescibacteria group bacterium]|nr:hypothetical protein [Patescibacteria group bacterium]